MKAIITSICLLVLIYPNSFGQKSWLNQKVRMDIDKYMVDKGVWKEIPKEIRRQAINEFYPSVFNLLQKKGVLGIDDKEYTGGVFDSTQYGIYSISRLSPDAVEYILLRNGKKWEIWEGTPNFADWMLKLIDYFKQTPNIDQKLLPYYSIAIAEVFERNSRNNQLGPWYDWHQSVKYKYLQKEPDDKVPEDTTSKSSPE